MKSIKSLKNLLRTTKELIFSMLSELMDGVSEGIQEEDIGKSAKYMTLLCLICGLLLLVGYVLMLFVFSFVRRHSVGLLIAGFLVAGVVSLYKKFIDIEFGDGEGPTKAQIEAAEQEAEEVHGELRTLTYNAVADISDYTAIHRPRDEFSIESSRDKKYYMDEDMAIHQYEVDHDGYLDRSQLDTIIRETQRCINRHARRYPVLVHDGHCPVVYDIKPTGSFLIVEIVLYSDAYKDKIEARKRARIERQLKSIDTYDQDF